ncbi:hypothetical protein [Methylotenera sp. G11]|uniref:hypothetical protein n=1 Tax=Methylotenera sp. G11 TaxID=1506585 RepID=UPI0006467B9F|nr:hypothetical protein [Methylotenera sp. G11]
MSSLLRSLLVLGVAGVLVVGCGKKEEAAPVEAAPAPAAAVEPAPAPAAAEPGGYEPTAEERVPGITIDPAVLAAESAAAAPAAEAAPAAAE